MTAEFAHNKSTFFYRVPTHYQRITMMKLVVLLTNTAYVFIKTGPNDRI